MQGIGIEIRKGHLTALNQEIPNQLIVEIKINPRISQEVSLMLRLNVMGNNLFKSLDLTGRKDDCNVWTVKMNLKPVSLADNTVILLRLFIFTARERKYSERHEDQEDRSHVVLFYGSIYYSRL
jgi:hypothetical protein